MQPPKQAAKYCLHSTEETIKAGTLSVQAVAETVFAIALYWCVAWYLETQVWLLSSALIAPFLLLRSKESVRLGVEMLLPTRDIEIDWSYGHWRAWVVGLFVAVATGLLSWWCTKVFLVGYVGWDLFWRITLIGTLDVFAGLSAAAMALVVMGGVLPIVGALPELRRLAVAAIGPQAVAAAVATVDKRGAPVRHAAENGLLMTQVVAAFAAIAGTIAGMQTGGTETWVTITLTIATIAGVFAWRVERGLTAAAAIAFFSGSIMIRLIASMRYLWRGWLSIPENWYRVGFTEDMRHSPELLPGISRRNATLTLKGLWQAAKLEKNVYMRLVFYPPLLIAFSVPPILYRISLKSTLWLYFPLVYVVSHGEKTKDLLVTLSRTAKAKLRLVLAFLTLAGLIWKTFVVEQGVLLISSKVITPLAYFWAINIFELRPWDWCNLVGTLISIVLFYWADERYKLRDEDKKNKSRVVRFGPRDLMWMGFLVGLRNLMTLTYLAISILFVTLLFSDIELHLPNQILSMLSDFFGRQMPMDVSQTAK